MKKINSAFLFPLCALVLIIIALSIRLSTIPPLGKVLDPYLGFIQNGNEKNLTARHTLITGLFLSDSVSVSFDDRKVPHIFARNPEDLYFSQGYVTASLRLWQMDFLTYYAGGRLSEIFSSEKSLEFDQNQRRLGIIEAAKASLQAIEADPETNKILTAYTRGVNAFIKDLSYKDYPVEYKLLDYRPELWTKLKSVLILKQMANNMSGYEEDLMMSKLFLALGPNEFNKLFPAYNDAVYPVARAGSLPINGDLNKLPLNPGYLNYAFLSGKSVVPKSDYNPALGSNCWAVSGSKTKSGYPILCNDPHLNLSLPNIWLEMQLSAPGVNVYGVSIPGTPAVIIGFNNNIAWGLTNGADDVKDWYKLKINNDYTHYQFDGKWLKLKYRIETIKRRGQSAVSDTVYSTLHGPIVYTKKFPGKTPDLIDYALRWQLQYPSNEFRSFIKLNRATNYNEFSDAISTYSSPVQNFTFASKDNVIAVYHQGKLAMKWPGQGKFLLDGTKSAFLYQHDIPFNEMPHEYNPASHYVLSANQQPATPNYKYYYNGYYSASRAIRIKQLLDTENHFDIGKMQRMQLDNENSFAKESFSLLLARIKLNDLSKPEHSFYAQYKSWDCSFGSKDNQAMFFDLWWDKIKDYTWDEISSLNFNGKTPDDYVLYNMILKDPANIYFDLKNTEKKEDASDIITAAFKTTFKEYDHLRQSGKNNVQWGKNHQANIMHLANITAFSDTGIQISGHPKAINAISENWGPSWRMIVELGEKPKAYGIYPGGQSGNIGSSFYDNFVKSWQQGRYFRLNYYLSDKEARQNSKVMWSLTNKNQ